MRLAYKIRRKSDGLFSAGGSSPHFSKIGKLWKQRNHLSNHLNQVYRPLQTYADCEIVTYEIVESAVDEMSISDYLDEIQMRKDEREAAYQRRVEKFRKEQRRQEYMKLRQEFENDTHS